MKRVLVYMLAGMALVGTSCSDFLDTIPHDALSPSTTWQTEKDAEKFLIGCYDGWSIEVFQRRRRYSRVCHLGIRKLFPYFR